MLSTRRVVAMTTMTIALSASAFAFMTTVSAAPPRPPVPTTTPVHPICGLRTWLPPALFRALVGILGINCGSTGTPPPRDVFGLEGYLTVVACDGTPAAPVDCGPPVPTAGKVVVEGQPIDTDANGFYVVRHTVRRGPVFGIVDAPPGRIMDCPAEIVQGSGGGPANARHDPVCRSLPAPPTTTTTTVIRTTTTMTTTTRIVGDVWGFEGHLGLQTCEGTPAAPVNCGPVVPTAGQIRIGSRLVTTASDGSYRASGFFGGQLMQGIIPAPPGRIIDCPAVSRQPSGGGLVWAHADVLCRSFPAPHDH
jgi:hypothetical protein